MIPELSTFTPAAIRRSLQTAFALLVLSAGAWADTVVLADPFSITGAVSDTNINTDIPARQRAQVESPEVQPHHCRVRQRRPEWSLQLPRAESREA